MNGVFLFDQHRYELEQQSVISADVIAERGYRSIGRPNRNEDGPRRELKRLGIPGWSIDEDRFFPGLLIPMYRATGELVSHQWKPRVPVSNRDGRKMKYASPSGRANVLDVHPRWSADRGSGADPSLVPVIRDVVTPLWITEGVKKADCLTSRGYCAIALSGVFNWRSRLGALGDWEDVPLKGRRVVICFDADARTNLNVLRAMVRFGRWLTSKGARIAYLIVPAEVDGTPVKGVDDYFAAGGTVENLAAACMTAEPQLQSDDTFSDARMAELIADEALTDRFVWVHAFGWMIHDGRVWTDCSDATVTEVARAYVLDRFREALARVRRDGQAGMAALNGWRSMLAKARLSAVLTLCRGVMERVPADFDRDRDLINTPDGVVDLRTGELLPADPSYLFTKITKARYVPGATHEAWTRALAAIPDDCREWHQLRLGQAITGHMTPDDLLVVQQGSGDNGKTTIMSAIQRALGGYSTLVSHRALLSNPDTHPTELMDLYGARLAVLEETPEARRLSVIRLKQTVGTTPMKARRMHKDPIQWHPTHSLFLSTNYRPMVDEVDHGTWRRLALLAFPYTFRKRAADVVGPNDRLGDPRLRERIRTDPGVQAAILAWLVEGARRWYAADQIMPEPPARVVADTLKWRGSADRILSFWSERLIAERGRAILTDELLGAFNRWLAENGHNGWSKETFTPVVGCSVPHRL